jgi:hypothetical protein
MFNESLTHLDYGTSGNWFPDSLARGGPRSSRYYILACRLKRPTPPTRSYQKLRMVTPGQSSVRKGVSGRPRLLYMLHTGLSAQA